ncbi:glycosyltransferase family 1 protein [Sphingomonas sp. HITSZ_GF]|uniref:glycosyltransferase family 4 protein n=1 Tax=Sphingomonas sp. HITSZ_GF TaxID=3037247 RepID=UPI00240E6BE7|nr:glycosyltransferase family 1 protein [Sphingomonas sp. HITSZ_GF]MDG2533782.1 glycosyltransferase family 1 protein [Sphingomonas sp. HITSZ_GF]
MKRPLTLDITRLLLRRRHATPTGIDRLELAYARALLGAQDRPVAFEAWVPGIGACGYSRAALAALLPRIEARWAAGEPSGIALSGLRPRVRREGEVRLLVSHHHLAELDRRHRPDAKTCVYVHDAIPADFPEYARPGGAEKHERRLRNAARFADGILVNSHATAASLARFLEARRPPLLVAPLGVEPRFAGAAPEVQDRPYFLCLGTIEPRKNHLLLLQVWRALAGGGDAPRLILVGRRGWENENVVDMLERSPAIRALVVEAGRVGDARLAGLVAGARAVLMPSFAEGFGLPVAEALAAGVPVIASDLPALRETGGDVPDYLDPLDGPGWMQAIRDYAAPGSARRAAQLDRLGHWSPPGWDAHFDAVLPFLDGL